MPLTLPGELLVKIGGDAKSLERVGQRSEAVLRRIGSAAGDVTKKVAGITATAAGIGYGVKKLFLDPFAEQQDALAALSQSLASTGKVGEESLRAVADEAARLQSNAAGEATTTWEESCSPMAGRREPRPPSAGSPSRPRPPSWRARPWSVSPAAPPS